MPPGTILKAGRALTTVASNVAPKAGVSVLSDFASVLPSLTPPASSTPTSSSNYQPPRPKQSQLAINNKHGLLSSEPALDPRDFGYRVVVPLTMMSPPAPGDAGTCSTLGRILVDGDNDNNVESAEEVMAAQREWDVELDMEPTRPHFEFYKEDPYYEEQQQIVSACDLFVCIESHEDVEDEEAA